MQRHFWRKAWRFRELFLILAWRDLTVRYKQTILGLGWAVLKPLLKLGAVIQLELLAETAPENRRS
jgi:ABC-type polysaccharide/polyol phosphate export permease